MTDPGKKPLPFSEQTPQATPVEHWPEEVRAALFTLVAFTVNQGSEVMNFEMAGLQAEGHDLGDFKVTIARTA